MKKIYTLVAAALICSNVSAQGTTTEGFENITLNPESYNNGSEGSGDFYGNGIILSNYYDVAWSSWNGFSISNITDNTTAGWGNQYSAFTGSGLNSENYAVYYPEGTISGNFGLVANKIDSFYISNSSYTGISMRDGDAFGKQFGSIYAADGVTVDGTNGEDFFKVWVIGEGSDGIIKDSVEVFLADYRFSDNSQDYILDTWLKVDLSNFAFDVLTVRFRFESSDNGGWGINTPTYFVLDDISAENILGLDENQMIAIEVSPNPVIENLKIQGESGTIYLRDNNGRLLFSTEHVGTSILNMADLASGIYFIELISPNGKVTRKIVK